MTEVKSTRITLESTPAFGASRPSAGPNVDRQDGAVALALARGDRPGRHRLPGRNLTRGRCYEPPREPVKRQLHALAPVDAAMVRAGAAGQYAPAAVGSAPGPSPRF